MQDMYNSYIFVTGLTKITEHTVTFCILKIPIYNIFKTRRNITSVTYKGEGGWGGREVGGG